jgi:hypothetical protein
MWQHRAGGRNDELARLAFAVCRRCCSGYGWCSGTSMIGWTNGGSPRYGVVRVCAGQGSDLIGVLARRPDAGRVRAELIKKDPRNVAACPQGRAAAAGLGGITVTCADAGDVAAYRIAIPADL